MVAKPGVAQFRPRPHAYVGWMEHAACVDENPEIFFDPDRYGEALQVCRRCPVRAQCRELGKGQGEGVWGGYVKRGGRPRVEEALLRPHGTDAAYQRHLRRGEPACEACRDAHRRARSGRKARR